MDQTTPANVTINQAKLEVMRSILIPLCPIMEKATLNQIPMEDEIFFNITLPLLTHLHTSLTGIVSAASLWTQIWETIWLECIMDGQWCWMGDYAVLMVKFGIHDTSVTGMQLTQSMRMVHWGPLHMCVMQLIPRVTLLSMGFFDERESYTANLSRLWPATNWALHMRATLTGSTDNSHF